MLNRVMREDLTEKVFEQRLRGENGKEHFKQEEQQVKRPKCRSEPGVFREKQGGHCGW